MRINAEPDEIAYLDLPPNSLPMGILFDNNRTVYVALFWTGQLAVIDTILKTVVHIYDIPSWYEGFIGPNPFQLARDTDGNIWISVRDFRITPSGELPQDYWHHLVKFIVKENTFQFIQLPVKHGGQAISFYNGYIWYGGFNVSNSFNSYYLLKIDSFTNQVVDVYYLGTQDGNSQNFVYIYGLDDCLWISDRTSKVYVFNTTLGKITNIINGLDAPLGITSDGNYLYIAENSQSMSSMGTIAKIDKVSCTIVERIETALVREGGPYYVMFDRYNNLWWTDNSEHIGVISPVGSKVYSSKPYCYFMTEIPGNTVWFSAVGSAHVGIVSVPADMRIDVHELDLNNDGIIDYVDISRVCKAFGSTPGKPRWDVEADFNGDGIIDYNDISMIARCFGKKTEL
jgi:hypothetical protein